MNNGTQDTLRKKSWQYAADALQKEHNEKLALISADFTYCGECGPGICSCLNVLYTRHGTRLLDVSRECCGYQLQQPLAHCPM